ncbi:hypothetical protein [Sphaerotilus microaerophilus]|uniref:hypothetical protein n=1 Tax=Sphaerotilus microaerophilus TaxID=2914710 RepID=UPI002073E2F0|nr:hypothetical protein [Sphaerotilus sp. FB-5]
MRPPLILTPRLRALLLAALAGWGSAATAQTDAPSDLDALQLADRTPAPAAAPARDWQGHIEAAAGQARRATWAGGGTLGTQRLSLALQLDTALAPGWRFVAANRLDLDWPAQPGKEQNALHTLQEAYASGQIDAAQTLDLGRVRAHFGVATGYNPTDVFRAGSLRSQVSADPNSLKRNRQGAVMLRGRHLGDAGAMTWVLSPRLSAHPQPSDAPFSLDTGASNARHRALLAWSPNLDGHWKERFSAQALLLAQEGQAPQAGLNLSALLGDATTAFAEWTGGRSRSQLAQALGASETPRFHQRLSSGLTWTSPHKLSLTLEIAHNRAAPTATAWQALQQGSPLAYAAYRGWTANAQELTTRRLWAVYASWPDALAQHLDLSAMLRVNPDDRSRLHWLELRRHGERVDLALQWQRASGTPLSDFAAATRSQVWQLSLRRYL